LKYLIFRQKYSETIPHLYREDKDRQEYLLKCASLQNLVVALVLLKILMFIFIPLKRG